LTDNDQSNSSPNPEKDSLHGRLVGELKLELVNPSAGQYERKRTVKDHLKDLTFWVSLLTLFAVFWYAYEAAQANKLTRTALRYSQGAIFQVGPDSFDPTQKLGLAVVNVGQLVATNVSNSMSLYSERLPLHDRTVKIIAHIDFGGPSTIIPVRTGTGIGELETRDIPSGDYQEIAQQRMMLGLKGTISFNDGVDDQIQRQEFCFAYLSTGPLGRTPADWTDCNNIAIDVAANQRYAAKQKHQIK
jgi:hypothetical protein